MHLHFPTYDPSHPFKIFDFNNPRYAYTKPFKIWEFKNVVFVLYFLHTIGRKGEQYAFKIFDFNKRLILCF